MVSSSLSMWRSIQLRVHSKSRGQVCDFFRGQLLTALLGQSTIVLYVIVLRPNYSHRFLLCMTDKRALIIDDDHANRSIWELVLNENGYGVNTADTIGSGMGYIGDDVSLYLVDY